jgi:hypothetical protein
MYLWGARKLCTCGARAVQGRLRHRWLGAQLTEQGLRPPASAATHVSYRWLGVRRIIESCSYRQLASWTVGIISVTHVAASKTSQDHLHSIRNLLNGCRFMLAWGVANAFVRALLQWPEQRLLSAPRLLRTLLPLSTDRRMLEVPSVSLAEERAFAPWSCLGPAMPPSLLNSIAVPEHRMRHHAPTGKPCTITTKLDTRVRAPESLERDFGLIVSTRARLTPVLVHTPQLFLRRMLLYEQGAPRLSLAQESIRTEIRRKNARSCSRALEHVPVTCEPQKAASRCNRTYAYSCHPPPGRYT